MTALKFPTIYLLQTRLDAEERFSLEEQIPALTYDAGEAQVLLGKIYNKQRALFELRRLHISTEEVPPTDALEPRPAKRRKVSATRESRSDSTGVVGEEDREIQATIDLTHEDSEAERASDPRAYGDSASTLSSQSRIWVVRISWFTDSVAKGEVLSVQHYLVYEGFKTSGPSADPRRNTTAEVAASAAGRNPRYPSEILRRARRDVMAGPSVTGQTRRFPRGEPQRNRPRLVFKPPLLIRTTTSEHDAVAQLPDIPDFLHTPYSCQRPTPTNPPNSEFIEQLMKIKTTRVLTGDKVGIRAYSSAIASLAAYPYSLTTSQEVSSLPGCGPKIAELYSEFRSQGFIRAVQEAQSDPKLTVLKLFYDVWGVAEATAREWYNEGWRDLDDVVTLGWDKLTRVQQIGVKFHDEFLLKIPRPEVEAIAAVILEHANRVRPGFHGLIVGGYRRGKLESGDVDLVLSHPDESATANFIEDLVVKLEDARYITHTLSLSANNTARGQMPVSWKGNSSGAGGGFSSGFDTLDKALVVWQDPNWTAQGSRFKKNPNPHRRVDIIVTPWKTAGCAVLGWSSATTFQRDLRRYCKRELGLKFDSSGIRSRVDGSWMDLEGGELGQAPDMVTAEKRVFEGLKLEWRPPEERSTG